MEGGSFLSLITRSEWNNVNKVAFEEIEKEEFKGSPNCAETQEEKLRNIKPNTSMIQLPDWELEIKDFGLDRSRAHLGLSSRMLFQC